MNEREEELKEFNEVADKVYKLVDCGEKCDLAKEKVKIHDTFENIRSKLAERETVMEEVIGCVRKLDEDLGTLHDNVSNLEHKFKEVSAKPISQDDAEMKDVIDVINHIHSELVVAKSTLQDDYVIGDWLIEKSDSDSLVIHHVHSRLDDTLKSTDELTKNILTFKSEIYKSLKRPFGDKMDTVETQLCAIGQKISSFKPVSARFVGARSQHDQCKVRSFKQFVYGS